MRRGRRGNAVIGNVTLQQVAGEDHLQNQQRLEGIRDVTLTDVEGIQRHVTLEVQAARIIEESSFVNNSHAALAIENHQISTR